MHRLGNAMLAIGGENGRALEEIEKNCHVNVKVL
jgi:hypothetical protein